MKNLFLMLVLIIFLSGCKKVEEEGPGTSLDGRLTLKVQNTEGLDLLNPATEGYLNLDYINHSYLIDGKKVVQYHPTLDMPKHMSIDRSASGEYYLNVHFRILGQKDGEMVTSIIEMYGYPADTLKAEVRNQGNSWGISKVWINGEEYDRSNKVPAVLVKIKPD